MATQKAKSTINFEALVLPGFFLSVAWSSKATRACRALRVQQKVSPAEDTRAMSTQIQEGIGEGTSTSWVHWPLGGPCRRAFLSSWSCQALLEWSVVVNRQRHVLAHRAQQVQQRAGFAKDAKAMNTQIRRRSVRGPAPPASNGYFKGWVDAHF